MYLHLGSDVAVRTADVVTVCDLDNASSSHITRAFLRAAQEADIVWTVPDADELLLPLLAMLPMQLLAYHTAVAKGWDVDKPRNLAKSVTVE